MGLFSLFLSLNLSCVWKLRHFSHLNFPSPPKEPSEVAKQRLILVIKSNVHYLALPKQTLIIRHNLDR